MGSHVPANDGRRTVKCRIDALIRHSGIGTQPDRCSADCGAVSTPKITLLTNG